MERNINPCLLRYTRCVKLQMISLRNLTFGLKEKFNSKLIMISSTKVSPYLLKQIFHVEETNTELLLFVP